MPVIEHPNAEVSFLSLVYKMLAVAPQLKKEVASQRMGCPSKR
jgi:hypothetical protein